MKQSFRKSSAIWLGAALTAIMVFAFASEGALAANPTGKQVVNFRVRDDLITLDPAHVGKPSDHLHAFNIYDGLVRLKAGSTEVEPNLAYKWDLSPDGKVYTFHLRKGVKWHKGYGVFTAKDVEYTIKRILNPKTKSRYRGYFRPLKKMEVVDDHTIKLHLDKPYPSFLRAVLAFRPGWLVSKKAIEDKGKRYGQDPIGTGPFIFDKWVRGSEIRYRANPDYYEKVHLERVVGKVIRKDTVAKLALERGDIDLAIFLAGATIKEVVKSKKLKVVSDSGHATHFLNFNLRRKPFNDLRMRQALLYATNKQEIADHVFYGMASARQNLLNPNVFGYEKLERNITDIAKAKKLLAEAGYPKGLDIEVSVMPTSHFPQIAAVLQAQWAKAGIRAKLKIPERAIYNRQWKKGQFDALLMRITRIDADQYLHTFFFGAHVPFPNASGYKAGDELILKARHTLDDKKREEFIKAAARKAFSEDLAGFALVNVNYVVAMQPYVKNYAFTFQDSHPWRQVWLEK